jgi:pimeloyl-ACP methyl ester carboxylesterase
LLLRSPAGELEYIVTGTGAPVTVFAHGLGGSIAETRPLASAVSGTRVFLQFRGHGGSFRPADTPDYADLAVDLAAVADHVRASRALGVSMGAAALLRLVSEQPRRFDRLVFFLPAVIDEIRSATVRQWLDRMAQASESGAVQQFVREEIPKQVRETPAAREYLRLRAQALTGLAPLIRSTETAVAVPDRSALSKVDAPALVIGAAGDPLHDARVARDLAGLLPDARLHIFDQPGPMWTQRAELRQLISGFLG